MSAPDVLTDAALESLAADLTPEQRWDAVRQFGQRLGVWPAWVDGTCASCRWLIPSDAEHRDIGVDCQHPEGYQDEDELDRRYGPVWLDRNVDGIAREFRPVCRLYERREEATDAR